MRCAARRSPRPRVSAGIIGGVGIPRRTPPAPRRAATDHDGGSSWLPERAWTRLVTALSTAALLGQLAGCASASEPSGGERAPGGNAKTTPRGLAWVTAQHLGTPASASAETDISGELGHGAIGARLRYPTSPGEDGDAITVAVGKGVVDELDCPDAGGSTAGTGCVRTARGTVLWEVGAPSEDPGSVAVGVRKGAVTVLVFETGPTIVRDPRDMTLPVTIDELFTLAEDHRIDVTTSKAAVREGESLSYWE